MEIRKAQTSMKQIRIGKDISLRWEITTDGVAIPLEGRDLTVELKSPIGKVSNMPFMVDGNVIIMNYYGYEQTSYGEYSLTLWENMGKPGQNVVDAIRAFKLVRTSQEEEDFIGGDLQVECVDLGTANLDILLGSSTPGDGSDLSDLQMKVYANTTRISAVEAKVEENAANIAGATSAASEALEAAQAAQDAASTASENAGQAIRLANEAKGIAEGIAGKADDALNKATEAAGKAAAAKTAATEAKTAADAAKKENETQNTRIESIAGKADTATRMLRFSSIIFDASIEEQEGAHISPNFQIVFVRAKGCFVASDGGKYYKVFPGSDDYNTTLDGVTKARQDRLYFIQSLEENRYYHYDGVELRHLTTSEPEIAGRVWNEDNATPKAESYYGSLKALHDLPKRLGLGRYLVTDNRERKKLDPKDSTKYLDGSPAKLDGTEGQCMWCWNGFYANIWHEGSRLIKAVTFDWPVGGETSVWIPAGGVSWLGAGVIDRGEAPYTDKTKWKLCSVINNSEQFRGGDGTALDATKHSLAPADTTPQITMLRMPATYINTTDFGNYARKRGEGWEANWFVARFVVEFLFEIIMGTENSQEEFNTNKDANWLYQGGFGTGVTDLPNWNIYNGMYPLLTTSVGLEAGDGVCLVPYSIPQTNGKEGEAHHTFNVPVFFGLVGAGYGNLWQITRGVIIDARGEKSLVYVAPSMYAAYDTNTVADKILVAECPRLSGYITRKSYRGLCCMPTEIGGSKTVRYSDNLFANTGNIFTRFAGGSALNQNNSGVSCAGIKSFNEHSVLVSSPLCYFTEDPVIPQSQSIANN